MATKTVDQSAGSSATVRPRARAPNVLPFPGLRLVPPAPPRVCADTIAVLERLLDGARLGQYVGLACVVASPDYGYRAEVAGSFVKDPTFARGAVASIDDALRDFVDEGSV